MRHYIYISVYFIYIDIYIALHINNIIFTQIYYLSNIKNNISLTYITPIRCAAAELRLKLDWTAK